MEVKWPTWAIDNALACLEEVRKRHQGYAEDSTIEESRREKNESIVLALNFAISVVEAIPQHTPPTLPSINLIARNAIGELISDIGQAIENFGRNIQDVNKWGWKKDPYD